MNKITGLFGASLLCFCAITSVPAFAQDDWCDGLKQEVISLSEDDDLYLLDVYRVEQMENKDRPDDIHDLYKTELYCEGLGAWSDGENTRIGMWYYSDPNDEWFIYYEILGGSKNYTCKEMADEIVELYEEIDAIYRTEQKEIIDVPDDEDKLYTTQLYCEGLTVLAEGEPTNIGMWNILDPDGESLFTWMDLNEQSTEYTCGDLKKDIIAMTEDSYDRGEDHYLLGIFKVVQKDNRQVPDDTYDLYTTELYCEGITESNVYGTYRIGMWYYVDPDGVGMLTYEPLE